MIRKVTAFCSHQALRIFTPPVHHIIYGFCHFLDAGPGHEAHGQFPSGKSRQLIRILPQRLGIIFPRPRKLQNALQHLLINLRHSKTYSHDALNIIAATVIIGFKHIAKKICQLCFCIPGQVYHLQINLRKKLLFSADPGLGRQRI